MSRRGFAHWVGLGTALLLAGMRPDAPAWAAAEPAAVVVERLEAAVAAHPGDPDLLWALARELRDTGRFGEAARVFGHFEQRFPSRRSDAAFEQGRALYEAGRHAEARRALERALARDGGHAASHLYRGLSLARLGEGDDADRSLRMAARLDPALSSETLLLRGLTRLEAGDTATGEGLLRQAAELDPGSAAADRARRVLGRSTASPSPVRGLSLYLGGGFEYDDNVSLDSGTDLPGLSTDRRDTRWLLSGGLHWRALQREDASVSFGYRFERTEHDELHAFDEESHLIFGSGAWRAGERLTLRLDGFAGTSRLDSDPYLNRAGVTPTLLLELGPRAGLLRGFVEAEARDFRERPSLASLERDGMVLGVGLEHYLSLPRSESGWSAVGLRYARTQTRAERDVYGLGPAFDHDRWETSWRLELPLFWQIEASSQLALGFERYSRRNVIDFLADGGVGDLDPERRRDWVFDARLALARPLTSWSDLELAWRRIERHSNVDLYAYDREVLGVNVRLHSF